MIIKVYPSAFRRRYARNGRTSDQQDAYAVARWLRETDEREQPDSYLRPPLTEAEWEKAELEGWILGGY